ncbi:hypothetical protein CNBE3390 [Cryptococcus deneoformans B-3501A]|uniref:hypothetical protein n=1 Tax=Cryptococcus deneoformans (strain B-3501A) TaxID=283643 RepID=UPI00004301F5|nr:hypothetical protein CNBE3390 [Cryptococcus neoformans var. neoformans B-3501A]EAL20418.1 hypothetical protein CNBE3390 [Cryptococcus neoformans var. neoformans B-3501A]
MAAAAYLAGPLTALVFLILETRNDYVRFHAYQSALLTTPLLVLLLLFNLLLPLPAFLRTLFIVASVGATLYAAFRAWRDAQDGLERYWLPYIGPIAERWVIPLPQKRHFTLPALPILLLLLATGFLLHPLFFPPPPPTPAGKYTSSPFLVKPSDFIDPPPPDRPSYLPAPLEPKKKGMLVPDAVHYVYGLKPVPQGQHGEELPYYAYLAMRSALINLKPKAIYFHYEHLPTGPWWDLIRPHLTLIKTQVPESIYGRPLKHFAHKADVLRLLAMKYSGGIYLDIDIYVYVVSRYRGKRNNRADGSSALDRLTICCTTPQHWVWKRPPTLDDRLSIPKVFVTQSSYPSPTLHSSIGGSPLMKLLTGVSGLITVSSSHGQVHNQPRPQGITNTLRFSSNSHVNTPQKSKCFPNEHSSGQCGTATRSKRRTRRANTTLERPGSMRKYSNPPPPRDID